MKYLIPQMFMVLLVTGCSCNPVTSEGLKAEIKANHREVPLTIGSWAQSVKYEIMSNIDDWQQYKGKVCSVRLFLQPDGLVRGVQSEGGDPALCAAAIAAVKNSTFLPVPKALLGQNGIPFDFKL